jgi:hypothetical protein
MLIPIRILLSVLMPCRPRTGSGARFLCWSIRNVFFTFIHKQCSFTLFCLSRQRHVIGVIIFNILDRILTFSGKSIAKQNFTFGWHGSGIAKMMPIRPDPDPQHWRFCFVALTLIIAGRSFLTGLCIQPETAGRQSWTGETSSATLDTFGTHKLFLIFQVELESTGSEVNILASTF